MAGLCRRFIVLRDFRLQYDHPSHFVHSVISDSPIVYGIGVTAISIYSVAMVIYSCLSSVYGEKILIWLTYWSYFSLTARFIVTTFNVWTAVYNHRTHGRRCSSAEKQGEAMGLPPVYKAQWALQNVSACSALMVSALYWIIMYTPGDTESPRSINSHGLNTIFALSDLLLSRAPVRMHHFIYTFLFVTVYIAFSVVYWAAGGENHKGENFIYPLLNYSEHPGRAVGVYFGVAFGVTPMLQLLLYALFRLREWMYGRCRNRKNPATTVEVNGSNLSLKDNSTRGDKRKSRDDNDISLEEITEGHTEFRGRNYTLVSNSEDGEVMVDVDLDIAMDEVEPQNVRPPLHTNYSQVSCTDSTKALLN